MNKHNNQTSGNECLATWQFGSRLIVIVGGALLTACVSTTPNLDAKFGEATRDTFRQQIANPDAGKNNDPVAGIDGRAARDAMDNYHKSFAKPEKSKDLSIGDGAVDSSK